MATLLLHPVHVLPAHLCLCSRRLADRHRRPSSPHAPHPYPPLRRFHASPRLHLRRLRTLGFDVSLSTPHDQLDGILSVVDYLKSKGFSDAHVPRLSFLCRGIFSSPDTAAALDPLFAFLTDEVGASPEQARDLVVRCPALLASDVQTRLRPTLLLLRELGVRNLSSPTSLNAHLLNTPVEKLLSKVRFLQGLGFSYEEAARACARLPAIFGYSVESNLRPKVEYLVYQMGRSVEELKGFPQYFAFSLERRIVPRHLHLLERNVRIPLQRMLMRGDEQFYARWK